MSVAQMSDSAATGYDNAMSLARIISRKHKCTVYVVSIGALWVASTNTPAIGTMYRIVKA